MNTSNSSWLQFLYVMFYLCPPYLDSEEKQVQLITTLDNTEVDLLTLEYVKVCVIPYIIIDPIIELSISQTVVNGFLI